MRKTLAFTAAAAVLTLAFASPSLHAAEEEATAPAEMTPEQVEDIRRAGAILRAFTVAMQQEEVPEAVKGRLLACLYNNKLGTISAAAGDVFEQNSELSEDRPGDIYRAAASVCGISFRKVEEGAPPPSSSDSSQEGR